MINTPEPEIRLELAEGAPVVLPIHPDALEERLKAAQALQPFRAPVVGQVLADKPAAKAGMKEGDTIVAVNGKPVQQWYDLLELLQSSPGQPLKIDVARGGTRQSLDVTSYVDSIPGPDGKTRAVGRIGVAVGTGFISEPLSFSAGAGGGLEGDDQGVHPDRPHRPGPVHRPDIGQHGGRTDPHRPARG